MGVSKLMRTCVDTVRPDIHRPFGVDDEQIVGVISTALGTRFTVAHDNWMGDGDRFLRPIAHADATFWERWAGVRYVEDQLLQRFEVERTLLWELRGFLTPEVNERLSMQTDRLACLLGTFGRFARQRESARELARTTRELLDALRLWYAEIELAAGGIGWSDVSREGIRLLAELGSMRYGDGLSAAQASGERAGALSVD